MKKLNVDILKDSSLLKHYRIIRRWACKNNNLNDADLELLIYFDCLELFTKQDYKTGTLAYSWDSQRWNRLLKNGPYMIEKRPLFPLVFPQQRYAVHVACDSGCSNG